MKRSRTPALLIGYDVEVRDPASEVTKNFLRGIGEEGSSEVQP